jgi:transcriptional regulator with XRE-family HTH domain
MSTPKNHQSDLFLWERISALMKDRCINAKEIAEIAGVVPSAVAKWKTGGKIGADKLQRIADHFGESVDWLLGRSDSKRHFGAVLDSGTEIDLAGAGEKHVVREAPGTYGAPPGYHLTTWRPSWSTILGEMSDGEIMAEIRHGVERIEDKPRGPARAHQCHGLMDYLNELANRKEKES